MGGIDRFEECGFVYADHEAASLAAELSALGDRYEFECQVPVLS